VLHQDSKLIDVADTTLTGAADLENGHFTTVVFADAQLRYSGGVPPSFRNCTLERSSFVFSRPAKNTLNILRSMADEKTRMSSIVRRMLPSLASSPPSRREQPSRVTYRAPTLRGLENNPER